MEIDSLWSAVSKPLYSLTKRECQLGMAPESTTTYFSANCTHADAEIVKEFLIAKVREDNFFIIYAFPLFILHINREFADSLTVILKSLRTHLQ